jgi:hypothetical protein
MPGHREPQSTQYRRKSFRWMTLRREAPQHADPFQS